MALATTGSLSFSQIASEFGGVGSHSMSEYYALAGLGVSGIPSSGAISFSQFRGKSNQVTQSVWVSSGYNSTSWVQRYYGKGTGIAYTWQDNNQRFGWHIYNRTGYGRQSSVQSLWDGPIHVPYYVSSSTYYWGNWEYSTGSMYWSSNNTSARNYYLRIKEKVTSWVDTSAYQNQTTTAQIST